MNLYLISQTENNDYDTFDSVVVAAASSKQAANISPTYHGDFRAEGYTSWCRSPEAVDVKYIGKASPTIKAGIVLASYNAG